MERKHPTTEEHDWPIPDEADISMGRLKQVLRKDDLLVGVGPRGMHSEYSKGVGDEPRARGKFDGVFQGTTSTFCPPPPDLAIIQRKKINK